MDKSQGTDTQNGGYAMTYRQIADATGIATSAGGSRTWNALAKIRRRLGICGVPNKTRGKAANT